MSKEEVLTIYDDIKRRVLGMTDEKKEPEGVLYSLMQVGHPLNAVDFQNPYTPFTIAALDDTAANISERQKAAFFTSQFLDHKVRMERDYKPMPVTSKISETWSMIIESGSPPPTAAKAPAEVLKRIENARAVLMDPMTSKPTEKAVAYKSYWKSVKEARERYTNEYLNAMSSPVTAAAFPHRGINLIDEIKQAEADWDTFGYRKEVEEAQATISSQGKNAVDAVLSFARDQYKSWQMAAGGVAAKFPYTYVLPSDWAEPHAGDSGWHRYAFSQSDTKTHHSESSSSWGGGGGVSFGFWSAGGNAQHSEHHVHDEFRANSLAIELSYGIVTVERPWLSKVLLNVKGWGLIGQDSKVVSTGEKFQNASSDAIMESFWLPSIPSQLIIVKDVRIKADEIQKFYDHVQNSTTGGGSFGWGPFTISGSSSWANSDTKTSCHMEDGWLVINGAQLIGFVLEVSPPCPTESMI